MGDLKRAYRIPRYEDDAFDTVIRLVEEGTCLKDAAIEAGVSRGTAARWMRKARKGQRLKPIGRAAHPRKDEYHRLRREGLTFIQATKRIGVTNSSGYNWDKELQKAVSASQRPRGDSTGYNRVMRLGQLLADSDTNPRFLRLSGRETIRDLHKAGSSMRQIAIRLGRHVSTVSREIARNKDARGDYVPYGAQRMAVLRRARPKQPKLVASPRLHDWVQERLRRQWSPAQISAILVREFPDDPEMRVCPETVY